MLRTALHLAPRVALTLAIVLPSAVGAESRDLEIPTADGLSLAATVWSEKDGAPGLLLMHQCNADRTMWSDLAPRLATAGFTVLAYDHRGLGESTNGDYDLATLSEQVLSLKGEHPEAEGASILLEPQIEYDHLIRVMDVVRSTALPPDADQPEADSTRVLLFPDIAIGDAP